MNDVRQRHLDASGIRHSLGKVLEAIAGAPGILFLDALDAARGDGTARAAADLIRIVREEARGWTVVASGRPDGGQGGLG